MTIGRRFCNIFIVQTLFDAIKVTISFMRPHLGLKHWVCFQTSIGNHRIFVDEADLIGQI